MYWRSVPLVIALASLAGCTASNVPSQLSRDHPASPAADQTPPPPRSTTLAVSHAAALPKPPAADQASGSGGHDHATTASPAAPSPGPFHVHNPGDARPTAGGASQAAVGGKLYVCPMHPEVVSADPNARCPKCSMKINKPKAGAVPTAAGAPATVPSTPATQSGHSGHGEGH